MGLSSRSRSAERPLAERFRRQYRSGAASLGHRLWRPILNLFHRVFPRHCWSFEAAALSGSVIAVIITASVLRKFDGNPLSAWTAPVTLNAFIAILVTIFYILLTTVLSKCVFQMRWIHYEKSHALLDFQSFHSVSAGGFGAFRYLLSFPRSIRLSFAAILIITMTSVGPLTQQLLGVETTDVVTTEQADLPVALLVEDRSFQIGPTGLDNLETMVIEGAYAGVLASSRQTNFTIAPQCPSGNCTWDNYATLAVQSTVQNVTSRLRLSDPQTLVAYLQNQTSTSSPSNDSADAIPRQAVSLPDATKSAPGITFDFLKSFYDMPTAQVPNITNTTMTNSKFTVFSIQFISDDDPVVGSYSHTSTNHDIQHLHVYFYYFEINRTQLEDGSESATLQHLKSAAWDCVFNVTVQPMQSQQINGNFAESIAGAPVLYDGSPCDTRGECFFNYTWNGSNFSLDAYSKTYLGSVLATILNSTVGLGTKLYFSSPNATDYYAFTKLAYPISESVPLVLYSLAVGELTGINPRYPADSSQASLLTIDDAMDNVARSLTSVLRSYSGDTVSGSVRRTEVIYRVRWAWISAPLVILILVALLVVVTAVETRQKGLPIWTDSALAMIVHGIDDYTRMDLTRIRTVEELEEACKGIKVYLDKEKLVLEAS